MSKRITWKSLAILLLIPGLVMVLLLAAAGAETGSKRLNQRTAAKIKDGQTNKNEVLLLLGDPQETIRGEGVTTLVYRSYQDNTLPTTKIYKDVPAESTSPYYLDEGKTIRRVDEKKNNQTLHAELKVTFKANSQTVLSHEYREFASDQGRPPLKKPDSKGPAPIY